MKKRKIEMCLKFFRFFSSFWPEIASRCIWILIITISLNSLDKSGLEKYVNMCLYVDYINNYAFFWNLFSGIFLAKVVKKAQNEPRGTFFRLEAIASHFLHIFSNLKTLIKSISPGGALQPLQSTRL